MRDTSGAIPGVSTPLELARIIGAPSFLPGWPALPERHGRLARQATERGACNR
jgi:hypothetical protein